MRNKVCFVSIDTEEDLVNGQSVPVFDGVLRLSAALPIFEKHAARATFFCTGRVLSDFPEQVRRYAEHGHEIGLHGFYDHVLCTTQTHDVRVNKLRDHMAAYVSALGRNPAGFRAVQNYIDSDGLSILEAAGIAYDSSVIARYPIGKSYIGYQGKTPLTPYIPSRDCITKDGGAGIVEIPLVPALGGIQAQGKWIQSLGVPLYQAVLSVHTPSLLSLSFHSWDVLTKKTDFLFLLDRMLLLLTKRGYRFVTGTEIYEQYRQSLSIT